MRHWKNFLPFILPITIFIIWYMSAERGWVAPYIIPPPERVVLTFIEFLQDGTLWNDTWASLKRMLQGYFWAAAAGGLLGVFMGLSVVGERLFSATLNAIRVIPPLAWIPLVILWFGIGELSKIAIIFKSAFFPILLNVIQGIESVPKGYIEVSKLLGASKIKILFKVILPAALPNIFVGLRLGLGASWMAVVAAELIASTSGLGYRLTEGRELSHPDVVLVGMIMIGVIGLFMDLILSKVQRRVLAWHINVKS